MTSASEAIKKLPQLPQAQYSLEEQLDELRRIANRLGLYDAAEWIEKEIWP